MLPHHLTAAKVLARQLIAGEPDITPGELARALHDQITTTRKPEDIAWLIGECVDRRAYWRRLITRKRSAGLLP